MIIHDVKQGTPEWKVLRLGLPTASQFHRLITPKTGKQSSQAAGYIHRLVAEVLLGVPLDGDTTDYMERGSALEAEAVRYFELDTGQQTQAVGFCTLDEGWAGCSPDRLVGDDGGLELKCPTPETHIGYMLDPGSLVDRYRPQVQGTMWITGRTRWHIMSYHPELQPVVVECKYDGEYIDRLADVVRSAWDARERALRKLAVVEV